jgi:hypothetical protein
MVGEGEQTVTGGCERTETADFIHSGADNSGGSSEGVGENTNATEEVWEGVGVFCWASKPIYMIGGNR